MQLPRPVVTVGADLAVLTSGGVDSAVLVTDQARQGRVVQPIYIRFGLAWETVEEAHLRRFLDGLPAGITTRALVALELPIADVYGTHWSVSGAGVPDEGTADSAVYLPGRNLLLLAKSSLWCALHGVEAIALGTLKGNPFADSGADFLGGFGSLVELGLDRPLSVMTPFAGFTKPQVLDLGRDLALEHTFSCIDPIAGRHCGRCNKCAERRNGFADAAIEDRTNYGDE
jgi:7-cyano-7-deazaguanine synthase